MAKATKAKEICEKGDELLSMLENILLNKNHGNDSLLYHYTSMKSACKILESNKFRLSNLLNMNDPLEFCRPKGLGFNGSDELNKDAFYDLQISLEERGFVTTNVQDFISKADRNIFVLTSRPEQALTSFGDFQIFAINPLAKKEAYELLRKYDNQGNTRC